MDESYKELVPRSTGCVPSKTASVPIFGNVLANYCPYASKFRKRDLAASPLGEAKELLRNEGKFFITPSELIPVSKADPFPSFQFKSIKRSMVTEERFKGNVTLVTFCFSSYAEPFLEPFRELFMREFFETGQADMLEIRPIMTRLKYFAYSRIVRFSAKGILPESLWDRFMIVQRPIDLILDLGIPNSLGSYVYLVDQGGLVRWRSSGKPSQEEIDTLKRLTKQLLEKHK